MYTRLFFCGPELDHIHTINAPRWSSSKGCGCFCPHPTAVIVFTPVQMNHFKWKNKPVRFKRTKLCGCEKTPWGIRELDSQEVVEPRNILSKLVVGLALVIFKFLTYHPTTVHVVCTCTCRLILCRELAANSPWQLHYLLWEQTSPSANFPFRFMHHVREM